MEDATHLSATDSVVLQTAYSCSPWEAHKRLDPRNNTGLKKRQLPYDLDQPHRQHTKPWLHSSDKMECGVQPASNTTPWLKPKAAPGYRSRKQFSKHYDIVRCGVHRLLCSHLNSGSRFFWVEILTLARANLVNITRGPTSRKLHVVATIPIAMGILYGN